MYVYNQKLGEEFAINQIMIYALVCSIKNVVCGAVWMAPRQETNDDNISKQRVKQVACYCDSFLLIFFC